MRMINVTTISYIQGLLVFFGYFKFIWGRWVYYRGKRGLVHASRMCGYHIDYDQAFSTGIIGILIISFIH